MQCRYAILVALFVTVGGVAAAQKIVPEPLSIVLNEGVHQKGTRITVLSEEDASLDFVAGVLSSLVQHDLKSHADIHRRSFYKLGVDTSLFHNPEAYRLTVTPREVQISGGSAVGVFYGVQTLRQLIDENGDIPCVVIEDEPRFAYRGLMLDPARHFLPVADIKRFIDAMALYKFNVLHLHLTDDQGWRVEIDQYPRLTEIGSIRDETEGDGIPHKGYYTQEELRVLVAYAARRGVEVVPEFDIPGHSVAAVVSYPWLACRQIDTLRVRTTAGVSPDLLCAGNDSTVTFIRDVVRELAAVFPSPRFHIGGDEAPLDRWKQCPKCQARKTALGLETEAELMGWLLGQAAETLSDVGKKPMCWYETDIPVYPEGVTVYAWRMGLTAAVTDTAAVHGWPLVLAPGEYAYFDYPQADDERSADWMPVLPLRKTYEFYPQGEPTIGVEATLWGEYMPDIDQVLYMAFPRVLALSEAAWCQPEKRSWEWFRTKLKSHYLLLEKAGIPFRRPSENELD